MLDELLGRATLKERIAALEEERDRLAAQLEAEGERRADAVRERENAERRVNRLEDRVAELEDRVERAETDERRLSPRGTETVRGERVDAVLDRLAGFEAPPDGALTAMVADGSTLPHSVETAFGERARLVADAAPCLAVADDAGLVSGALSVPVAPEPFDRWDGGFRIERSWFRPTGRHTVALVRADVFAIGEFDGDERVDVRGFESDVRADHSKGGFSQKRFERLRDEQVADHLERCRAAVEERTADRLIVLGDGRLVGEFPEADAAAAVDATGDPEAALADAVREFWTVRLTLV